MDPATLLVTCVAILQLASGQVTRVGDQCDTPLSPASTFKLPHALVALETGVVTVETVEKWDGTRHPGQPSWDADHTVLSAMRPSVLWFFQRVAPRIGADRMRGWLQRFAYGNADPSGPITQYWVNGTLRISVNQQLRFLERFYRADLPVSAPHVAAVTTALAQKPGTLENARGVHPITLGTAAVPLNAKTGATSLAGGESVSWLVGRLGGYVFASAAWRRRGEVDGLAGARAAERAFSEQGRLK